MPDSECHVTFNNLKNLNCLRLRKGAESLSPLQHLDVGPHTSVKDARSSKKQERMRENRATMQCSVEGKEGNR